ncbi:MAG: LacI family DNA-binding transcriptional regulator [Ginsengibacter sp.]|jgi:LacI family transcriptional regulator
MERVTINDIARELNVTAATVSRALNDHPAISDGTKALVRAKAEQMNYRQNKMASSLRSGKSHIWGVLIPSAKINFFGSVVHGIENVASENGFTTLLYQSNELMENEVKGLDTFFRSGVDGVIASIALGTTNYDHFLEIKNKGIPLIFFDRSKEELGIPSVVIDDYKGAFNATDHLIRQGCKRIAHIGGPEHSDIFKNRMNGYKDALLKNNLPVEEDLIVTGNLTVEGGRMSMEELLNLENPPDGIFAAEDFTALGAMLTLKEKKISIPEDMALIGFANEEFGKYITPTLSTVDQQTVKMGEEAARLLMKLSKGNNFYKEEPVKIVLEPEMIFRESSMKKVEAVREYSSEVI